MYLPSYAHQHQGILLPSHSTTSSIHHLLETSENICRLKESQFANALANTVVVKVEIINNHVAMIVSLTTLVGELTLTNKRLAGQLADRLG